MKGIAYAPVHSKRCMRTPTTLQDAGLAPTGLRAINPFDAAPKPSKEAGISSYAAASFGIVPN